MENCPTVHIRPFLECPLLKSLGLSNRKTLLVQYTGTRFKYHRCCDVHNGRYTCIRTVHQTSVVRNKFRDLLNDQYCFHILRKQFHQPQ